MIITLDMGTTNTRFRIFNEDKITYEKKISIGAGEAAVKGNNTFLKAEVGDELKSFLADCGIEEHDIEYIAVSGMACSEHGLYNVKHIEAPVSFEDLCRNVKKVMINEISNIPFLIIPGVKNRVSDGNIVDADMMRGEETEFFGLRIKKPCVAIFPGSHSKFIHYDGEKIVACETGMGGEIIKCISGNTILKSDLPEKMPSNFNTDYLIKGFDCCEEIGFSKTAFKVRSADIILEEEAEKMFSFLVGAVISCELYAVKICEGAQIVVGGSEPLRNAFAVLAEYKFGITPYVPGNAEYASAYGAFDIAKKYISG